MNAGEIWWGRMGNSLQFLSRISDTLRTHQSAIMQIPERFPWREEFRRQVDRNREQFSLRRRMIRLEWTGDEDPGAYILRELTPRPVQAGYWPGQTPAEYLGSLGDLELCDMDVWVRGLHGREEVIRWAEFAGQYAAAAGRLERRAVFLLEYDGPAHQSALLSSIVYQFDEYDARAFCLELSLSGRSHRGYLTELAIRIGRGDPELCAALLSVGDRLAEDPAAAVEEILRRETDAEGRPFPPIGEGEIASAVWRAAVVLLFPVLEEFRFDFISRHEAELAKYLPITNSNGEQVTEPSDLELGSLFYVVNIANYAFSPADVERVSQCRDVRNQLAHNKQIPYEEVRAVLEMSP